MAADRAFEAALDALRQKERTSAEVHGLLERRGYGPDEREAALSQLTAAGELDDRRFAHAYAEDKRELQGWGAERIREALLARGIAPQLVDDALAADSRQAQVKRASRLLRERNRALGTDRERQRALGFLTRRGYDYEVAYEAVRNAERV
jgi:regulatory protein